MPKQNYDCTTCFSYMYDPDTNKIKNWNVVLAHIKRINPDNFKGEIVGLFKACNDCYRAVCEGPIHRGERMKQEEIQNCRKFSEYLNDMKQSMYVLLPRDYVNQL